MLKAAQDLFLGLTPGWCSQRTIWGAGHMQNKHSTPCSTAPASADLNFHLNYLLILSFKIQIEMHKDLQVIADQEPWVLVSLQLLAAHSAIWSVSFLHGRLCRAPAALR